MRILLAEDDPLLGDGLRTGLRQLGFQVDWVRDGRAAERELRAQPYAAAVLDLGLPAKDGLDVVADVRSHGVTTREFDLLHALVLNAGRVLSREQLEQNLYSWRRDVASNTIEVHIHHLRRKLRPGLVQTVRGVGYSLVRDGGGA